MKWKTTLDEAPRGLEPSDFEDWFWKRVSQNIRDSCWIFADFATLHHLELELKDVERKIPQHFYTDRRGSELAPAEVQKGYTVAILCAKRHVSKFGDPGIRHEDPRMIKVLQQLSI